MHELLLDQDLSTEVHTQDMEAIVTNTIFLAVLVASYVLLIAKLWHVLINIADNSWN